MSAVAKSSSPAPDTKFERDVPRERTHVDRTPQRIGLAGRPADDLQSKAGNSAMNVLVAPRQLPIEGSPLPPRLRAEFESRFGEDFTGVRVHTDMHAAKAAADVHAKAYTVADNVVFGARRFAPETFEGRRLLAHELAHVVQQRRGGSPPALHVHSAAEAAAKAAAQTFAAGTTRVRVGSASGVGIARDPAETDLDSELDQSFAATFPDVEQSKTQARRRPGDSAERDDANETVTPRIKKPPKADEIDPALRDKSRQLREQGEKLRARENKLNQEKQNQQKGDAKAAAATRKAQADLRRDLEEWRSDLAEYRGEVRAAEKGGTERGIVAKRLARRVRGQPAMTPQDMFNKIIAMRGFDNAPGLLFEREKLDREYKSLQRQIATIDALEQQNDQLKREIAKLDRERRKKGKLSSEDSERQDKLKATLAANKAQIKPSAVTALRKRARSLYGQLSISSLRDPNADATATGAASRSRGAAAGRGDNTYVIVQVVDANGKILAAAPGKRSGKGHAEQNAIVQLEQQLSDVSKKRIAGATVQVVGDQVVCTKICKKDLAAFAERHNIERVDGYTFSAVKPGAKGKQGRVLSPKTTAHKATTVEAENWTLQGPRAEGVYQRGVGILGHGELTEAEKRRHKHQKKQSKTKPTPKAGAKGPKTQTSKKPAKKPPLKSAAAPATRKRLQPKATGKSPGSATDNAKTPTRRRASATANNATPPVQRVPPARTAERNAPAPSGKSDAGKPGAKDKPLSKAAKVKKQRVQQATRQKKPATPPSARAQRAPRKTAKHLSNPQTNRKRERRAVSTGADKTPPPQAAQQRPARQKPAAMPPQTARRKQVPAKTQGATGGRAQTPTPAQRKPNAPPNTPGRPSKPPPGSADDRRTTQRHSLETSHGTQAFLAPGTAGASAQAGVQAKQEHGKGITTGQTANVDGSVSVDVTAIADSNPRKYRVTLNISISGDAGATAGKENEAGNARVGAGVSASGTVAGSFSQVLTAEQAEKYRAAALGNGGGEYQELEIVRLLAEHKRDAAINLLRQANAATGSAAAAKNLKEGDAASLSADGTVGASLSASGGEPGGTGAGVELGIFRSGKIERRVEKKDGKIVVTMTIDTEAEHTLGATGSEGVGTFGLKGTWAKSRLRSVSFSLDPGASDFDSRFNAITGATSIEQLEDLKGKQPPGSDVADTTGQGESRGHAVSAGVAGFGAHFTDSGSFHEQHTRDERGESHRYDAASSSGLDLTVGDKTIASTQNTDTFVADVAPDNTATGEAASHHAETDWGRSLAKLKESYAKNPVTTATGVLTGKTKVLTERVDTSGAALSDDSYGRIAALANDPAGWNKAFDVQAGVNRSFGDWQATRQKVLAANGDRNAISRAMAEWESGGTGREASIENAVGKTGVAFEFPDELADQKPVYDQYVVGDPVAHARELAARGQDEAALNELRAANAKLSKMTAAVQAQSGAFDSKAKLAEMLNRVSDRQSALRTEIRQLTAQNKPRQVPVQAQTFGPPTVAQQEAADHEAEERKKRADAEELQAQQEQLFSTCTVLREEEQKTFVDIRSEMGKWHFSHLSASIDMMHALNKVRDSWSEWDDAVQKLRKVLTDRGDDPAKADKLAPDRATWGAVNSEWKAW
jgi:pyrimidine deaminase RibD-like protein